MAIKVESDSLNHGERVPEEHAFGVPDGSGGAAAEGGNRSPHLSWSGHPEGTQSFALIVFDPDVPADATDVNQEGKTLPEDAPRADFAHWLLVDIPADVTELPEGAGSTEIVVGGKDPGPSEHGVGGVNSYTDFLAGDPDMERHLRALRRALPALQRRAPPPLPLRRPRARRPQPRARGRVQARRRAGGDRGPRARPGRAGRHLHPLRGTALTAVQRERSSSPSSELASATRSSTAASTSPRSTVSTGECM